MPVKMEKTKLLLDIGIVIFGLLAALFAILSLVYGSRIDFAKRIEEERLKTKIAEANAVSEKAKEEAANALSSAANTNERAIKLDLKLEEQKERAARAEKELLDLQEKVKPRSVSSAVANKLIAALSKLPNKNINLSSSLGDGEAASYANQIKAIFERAGWKVDSGIGFSTYTGIGLYMLVKSDRDMDAKKLLDTFEAGGILFQVQIQKDGAKIQIFVGSKNNQDIKTEIKSL